MAAKVNTPADTLREFRGAATRKRTYKIDKSAKRAPVADINDVAYVARGTHASSEVHSLVLVDGSSMVGVPLCAVGEAIALGVVTPAEIIALWSESVREYALKLLSA